MQLAIEIYRNQVIMLSDLDYQAIALPVLHKMTGDLQDLRRQMYLRYND